MGTYTLDGLPLDDPARRWFLEQGTGVRIKPARASTGATLPGRDGLTPSTGSTFDPGAAALSLYVGGASHAAMMAAWEVLSGVMGQRHRLLPLVHDYGGGVKREAMVEILASSEPSLITHRDELVQVVCQVPGVFWRSVASSDSVANITATQATTALTGLAGSTGPVNDALLQFRGNFSSVTITDPVSGDSLTINEPLTSTQFLVVDTANWVARKHSTDTWSTTAGTDALSNVVSNRGMGPMFTLNPDFTTGAGRIRLTVKGTNPQVAPQVTVRAKSSYL